MAAPACTAGECSTAPSESKPKPKPTDTDIRHLGFWTSTTGLSPSKPARRPGVSLSAVDSGAIASCHGTNSAPAKRVHRLGVAGISRRGCHTCSGRTFPIAIVDWTLRLHRYGPATGTGHDTFFLKAVLAGLNASITRTASAGLARNFNFIATVTAIFGMRDLAKPLTAAEIKAS